MSKKGGKSTPKQLDKTENRVTPTNEFIPGIPDTEWDFLNEVDQVNHFQHFDFWSKLRFFSTIFEFW